MDDLLDDVDAGEPSALGFTYALGIEALLRTEDINVQHRGWQRRRKGEAAVERGGFMKAPKEQRSPKYVPDVIHGPRYRSRYDALLSVFGTETS